MASSSNASTGGGVSASVGTASASAGTGGGASASAGTGGGASVGVGGGTSAFPSPVVSAGSYHSCAVTPSGGLKCWGRNDSGQLGDGTTTDSSVPVDVTRLTSGVIGVAGGGLHTCALTAGGGVKCWGSGNFGELGDGLSMDSNVPVDVSGLSTRS